MSSERRSRRRVVALCRARDHCFMSAGRKLGGEHDWHLANAKTREVIRFLSAIWVSSEPDHSRGPFNWRDTYRVSLAGRTLDDVGRALRMAGVYDPPTYGTGRETMPTGSGERSGTAIIRERQAAATRKLANALERGPNVSGLLASMFGSAETGRSVLASAPQMKLGDYPDDWCFAPESWAKCCDLWNGFATAYHLCSRGMVADPASWAMRARTLELWVQRMTKQGEGLEFHAGKDAIASGRERDKAEGNTTLVIALRRIISLAQIAGGLEPRGPTKAEHRAFDPCI